MAPLFSPDSNLAAGHRWAMEAANWRNSRAAHGSSTVKSARTAMERGYRMIVEAVANCHRPRSIELVVSMGHDHRRSPNH